MESLLSPPAVLVSQAVAMSAQLFRHVTIVQTFTGFTSGGIWDELQKHQASAHQIDTCNQNAVSHTRVCYAWLNKCYQDCYPFSIRKLLTATGSEACPLLCLPIPV
jgi:predicted oxidoreductase